MSGRLKRHFFCFLLLRGRRRQRQPIGNLIPRTVLTQHSPKLADAQIFIRKFCWVGASGTATSRILPATWRSRRVGSKAFGEGAYRKRTKGGFATNLADRVKQLEIQVAELLKAIGVLLHNPNWREVISLSPSEIEQWARAIKDRR